MASSSEKETPRTPHDGLNYRSHAPSSFAPNDESALEKDDNKSEISIKSHTEPVHIESEKADPSGNVTAMAKPGPKQPPKEALERSAAKTAILMFALCVSATSLYLFILIVC